MTGAMRALAWSAGQQLPVVALNSLVLAAVLFLVVPILVIVPISFSSAQYLTFPPPGFSLQWYQQLVERPEWIRALWMSLRVACLCAVLSLGLGIAAALALVRGRIPGKPAIYAFILSPMILPSVIVGLGTFFLLSRLRLTGSVIGVALGHTVAFAPMVVIIVSTALQSFDRRIEQAAIILGAPPIVAFCKITLPAIAPGVISAALFSFLLSFDEVLISLFLVDPVSITLPIQIWNNAIMQISPTIAAVSVFLTAVSLLVLAGVNLARRLQR